MNWAREQLYRFENKDTVRSGNTDRPGKGGGGNLHEWKYDTGMDQREERNFKARYGGLPGLSEFASPSRAAQIVNDVGLKQLEPLRQIQRFVYGGSSAAARFDNP